MSNPNLGSLLVDFSETDDQIIKAIELQDEMINKLRNKNCAHNATLKSAKLKMVHNMTPIIITLFLISACAQALVMSGPALFEKDQRMDELILKKSNRISL